MQKKKVDYIELFFFIKCKNVYILFYFISFYFINKKIFLLNEMCFFNLLFLYL